jgi:hypothetical protein
MRITDVVKGDRGYVGAGGLDLGPVVPPLVG